MGNSCGVKKFDQLGFGTIKRIHVRLAVFVPREGIEPPTPASSKAEFGLYHSRCETYVYQYGIGRYPRDYCWDSLASLYTFFATIALRSLARDCFI